MGLYRWNSGGQYRGKLWEQDLLADSQVCLNLTYLNKSSRLFPCKQKHPYNPSRISLLRASRKNLSQ